MSIISHLQAILDGFDFTYLSGILSGLIPSLICICFHELCHGWAAFCMGDSTAKDRGRLSLNPLRHIDPMGLLMMLIFRFGWAKPVPVNMYRFKNPKRGMALTALAGPAGNLFLCVFALLLYGLLYIPFQESGLGRYFLQMLYITAYMSLGLGVFNLLPVPPLDGSKLLFSVMNDEAYYKLMRYERYGMILMILLVYTGVLGKPVSSVVAFVFDRLFVVADLSFRFVYKIVF